MEAERDTLREDLADLNEKLNELKISEPEPTEDILSDQAVRKRLMRLCERKKDGNLGFYQYFGNCLVLSFQLYIWGSNSKPVLSQLVLV